MGTSPIYWCLACEKRLASAKHEHANAFAWVNPPPPPRALAKGGELSRRQNLYPFGVHPSAKIWNRTYRESSAPWRNGWRIGKTGRKWVQTTYNNGKNAKYTNTSEQWFLVFFIMCVFLWWEDYQGPNILNDLNAPSSPPSTSRPCAMRDLPAEITFSVFSGGDWPGVLGTNLHNHLLHLARHHLWIFAQRYCG